MEATQVEWITKAEAAKRLGVGERRILGMAAGENPKLRSKLMRVGKGNQLTTVIHAGDVERAVTERDEPRKVRRVSKVPALQTSPPVPQIAAPEPLDLVGPTTDTLFLALDGAAKYSGLPKSFLLTLIGEKKLRAFYTGPRKGGGWRISRTALYEIGDIERD